MRNTRIWWAHSVATLDGYCQFVSGPIIMLSHAGKLLLIFSSQTNDFTQSSDKTVKVWNVETRQCINTFMQHTDQVWGAKYSQDGTKVVSAGDDCSIHVYDCPV